MADKKDIDKRFFRFDRQKDKKLFCRLFLHCFFTQLIAWVTFAAFAASQLVAFGLEAGLPPSDIEEIKRLIADEGRGRLSVVLIPAVAAFLLINNFFYEINKFGDDPEWKKRYIAEKISTEKTNNIPVIIIALCLLNYLSFAGI